MQLTAAITQEDEWFVARCLEVDVVSQGHSLEEAKANLADAVALALADDDLDVGPTPLIVTIDVG
jgi:predicted RNase H-like HicB family nuclease